MSEVTKYQLVPNNNIVTDFRSHFSFFRSKKSSAFVYGVVFVFIAFTVFLAFSPSSSTSSSTWFINFFTVNNTSPPDQSFRSHLSPISPQIPSNFTQFSQTNSSRSQNITSFQLPSSHNLTKIPDKVENLKINDTIIQTSTIPPQISPISSGKDENLNLNDTNHPEKQSDQSNTSSTSSSVHPEISSPTISPTTEISTVETANSTKIKSGGDEKGVKEDGVVLQKERKSSRNDTGSGEPQKQEKKEKEKNLVSSLIECDLYDGDWVRDDSYPLYEPGSCKIVDEQFNCILNGRPDNDYQKLKWKPKGCTLPRMNGRQMLKLLRGKRLVFVGDSLNRNMWESLVCILKSSVKHPKNVFEAYGRHTFRTEASYSFVFKDYNCTVEFFVAPFLVQPWDVKDKNGTIKETLRLDVVVEESIHFKDADFVVFNTGHWWTHEKTSKGEDYYQEGSNVYKQLDVQEAFRKAVTTWGRWVDANINPQRTHVFFRGYSSTHFSGGQWNSGGQCDSETEPIRNDTYLTKYPWKMRTLETVMKGMKTPVSYLNITKLTDYRKDAHPSIYRKQRPSTEEKRTPLRFQDCSHWCLPGVPDSWNELLYAEILRKQFQNT